MINKVIKGVLIVGIVVLVYLIINSVSKPIKFQQERDKRYAQIIERLKQIRTAQIAFYDKFGRYTSDFDSLIQFIKNDSMPIVKAIGTVPDTLTEEEAVKLKIVYRDTIYIPIRDTLFPKNFIADSLKYVPFGGGITFKMQAGEVVTGSKVKVKVFEVKDPKPFDPTFQLKVGSLTEASTAGNWE
ncbi:MAG: hypothetical protein N2449_06130 [Bacteroidales bacterium]|nr:hypothetical protein [Bacteroidales bacterium]